MTKAACHAAAHACVWMLAGLLHASSQLLAPGLAAQLHSRAPAARSQHSRAARHSPAAVKARSGGSPSPDDQDGRWSASAAVWETVANGISGREAAFHSSGARPRHQAAAAAAATTAQSAPTEAAPAKRRRGRPPGSGKAKAATSGAPAGAGGKSAAHRPGRRTAALTKTRKLAVPGSAKAYTEAGHWSDARAADSGAAPDADCMHIQDQRLPQQPLYSTQPTAQPARQSSMPSIQTSRPDSQPPPRAGSLPPPPPPPPQRPEAQTPFLRDFLAGSRFVRSVYRQQGLHEMQLQQEFAEPAVPAQPLLADVMPPVAQEALPQPQVGVLPPKTLLAVPHPAGMMQRW